jgi:hypothetical protein
MTKFQWPNRERARVRAGARLFTEFCPVQDLKSLLLDLCDNPS